MEDKNLKPCALDIYSGAAFYNVPNSKKNFYHTLPRVCRDLVAVGRDML